VGFVEAFDKGYKLFVNGLLFQKHIFQFSDSDEDVEVPLDIVELEDFREYLFLILFVRLVHPDVFLYGLLGVLPGILFNQVVDLISCDCVVFAQNPRVAILLHVDSVQGDEPLLAGILQRVLYRLINIVYFFFNFVVLLALLFDKLVKLLAGIENEIKALILM
jgi:hypothetical protein